MVNYRLISLALTTVMALCTQQVSASEIAGRIGVSRAVL
ncbi:putative lipoprotein [Escherichia coli 2731150]|nr:putative lipoprotein [Escherichia coli 2762100]EMW71288.1 putative lipoprotein [Escherichia coli 2731150]EZA70226.1 lipoprotein [Escherichia coli O25:NM str. E2539C1]CAD6024039.1 Uncharacterised protein [Escherichia coli]